MEDRIEVGEYVRTKDGIIDKVDRFSINCCVWHCENGMCIDECNRIGTYLKDIVKHSKQLIDLIEVKDIVNGHLVTNKYRDVDEYGNDFWCLIIEDDSLLNRSIREENIQTILTKESYMANCYKVGGEDE